MQVGRGYDFNGKGEKAPSFRAVVPDSKSEEEVLLCLTGQYPLMKVRRKRTKNGIHILHTLDLMEELAAEEEPQLVLMDKENIHIRKAICKKPVRPGQSSLPDVRCLPIPPPVVVCPSICSSIW